MTLSSLTRSPRGKGGDNAIIYAIATLSTIPNPRDMKGGAGVLPEPDEKRHNGRVGMAVQRSLRQWISPIAPTNGRGFMVEERRQRSRLYERSNMVLPFADRLAAAVKNRRNPVLVGLDPRAESLPEGMLPNGAEADPAEKAAAYGRFCRGVIDVVAPLVPAVKPQAAFFEQLGPAGMAVLAEVIALCPAAGPAGDSRRQAERHRLDRRGLRPGNVGLRRPKRRGGPTR